MPGSFASGGPQSGVRRQQYGAYVRPSFFIGKRVVITGASSGVGNALSYWYLNHGAHVVLVGNDEDLLKKVAQQYPS